MRNEGRREIGKCSLLGSNCGDQCAIILNLAAILKTSIFMSTVINFVSIKGLHTMEDMTILQKNLCASVFN
jgi:hypothetical protein